MYHEYNDKCKTEIHSIKINDSHKIIKLIESCGDVYIRIWNFHKGKLLKKIFVCDDYLNCICLWDDNYAFVGCDNKLIYLVNL